MTMLLLKRIYHRLLKEDWNALPLGLKGGRIGLTVFFALCSESFINSRARKLSGQILSNILGNSTSLSNGLLSGKLGLAWSLHLLCQKSILERDKYLEEFLGKILNEYMQCYYFMPVQVVAGDNLFSGGIYMLQQYITEDSLEWYIVNERLIYMVEECERQLNESIRNIYNHRNISLSILHSFLFFLLETHKKNIYPYKTGRLIDTIKDRYSRIEKKPLCDEYIYHFLMQDDTVIVPTNLEDRNLFLLMGELGFYSLLYDNQGIFWSAWQQVEEKYPRFKGKVESIIKDKTTPVAALCGWGYGLLQCKTEGYV